MFLLSLTVSSCEGVFNCCCRCSESTPKATLLLRLFAVLLLLLLLLIILPLLLLILLLLLTPGRSHGNDSLWCGRKLPDCVVPRRAAVRLGKGGRCTGQVIVVTSTWQASKQRCWGLTTRFRTSGHVCNGAGSRRSLPLAVCCCARGRAHCTSSCLPGGSSSSRSTL